MFNFFLEAVQPVWICESCRGDVVPLDEQGHRLVRLIRESSKAARCSDST